MSKRLLLVGTDDNLKAVSQAALEGDDAWLLETFDTPDTALAFIAQTPPDAVLYDMMLAKYPLCEFARQVQAKTGDASIAIIIAGDGVNEAEIAAMDNVWSFPSPIIPEILVTILSMASKKDKDNNFGAEVDSAIGNVLTDPKPPHREYVPIEGIEVQTLYGEDDDGVALSDTSDEQQELDIVEVDDSSEFIGVNDDDDLEAVEIVEEPEAGEIEEIVEPEELEELEVLEVEDDDDGELETIEILEFTDDDELEFAEAEPLDGAELEEVQELEPEPASEGATMVEEADTAEPEQDYGDLIEVDEAFEAEPEQSDAETIEVDAAFEAEPEQDDESTIEVDGAFEPEPEQGDTETLEVEAAFEPEPEQDDTDTIEVDAPFEAEQEGEDTLELADTTDEGDESELSDDEAASAYIAEQFPSEEAQSVEDAAEVDINIQEEFSSLEQAQTEEAADDEFSFDDVEAEATDLMEEAPLGAIELEEPAAATVEDDFSFDDIEADIGVEPGEAAPSPVAAEEDFDFDDFESDIGMVAAPATPSEADAFSFDEAEGLAAATVEAVVPAATMALEGLASQGIPPEKLDSIIRETVEKVVWDVVPDLAEKLISEAIEKLKEPQ